MAIAPTGYGKIVAAWHSWQKGTLAAEIQLVRCIWMQHTRERGVVVEHLEGFTANLSPNSVVHYSKKGVNAYTDPTPNPYPVDGEGL